MLRCLARAAPARSMARRPARAAPALAMTTRSVEQARTKSTRTLQKLFSQPPPPVLRVRDVASLLEHLGGSVERGPPGAGLRVRFPGVRPYTLEVSKDGKDLGDRGAVHRLRQLLTDLGHAPSDARLGGAAPQRADEDAAAPRGHGGAESRFAFAAAPPREPALVLLDHGEARVFGPGAEGLSKGAAPAATIHPPDPEGVRAHLRHKKHPGGTSGFKGDRVPESSRFYDAVEAALRSATDILVVSHAAGKSCAAAALLAHARLHKPELAARIVNVSKLDTSHTTTNEALAFARRFFESEYRVRDKLHGFHAPPPLQE